MRRALHSGLLALILGLFVTVGWTAPAMAQTGITGETVRVCVARAAPSMTPRALFARGARFDCDPRQIPLGAGDFWVRSERVDRTGPLEIRVASLWQRRITLHALYADGTIVSEALDQKGISHRLQLGAIIAQPLAARAVPLVRLLWHVEGSPNLRGILRGAEIATPEQGVRFNLSMAALYAGFAGFCLALLCYHLALWVALRHPFQLAYCAMAVGLLCYAASSSGALAWAWPDIANNDRIRVNYLTLGLATLAALVFARTFFEPRVFVGWVGRLFPAAGATMLLASLAYALLDADYFRLFDRLFTGAFVVQVLVVLPTLWRAWRLRSNYLWMFALAWGAPITFGCVRAANAFGLVRWNFWLDTSTILTMTFEALLSSMAIAYRIRVLGRERDAALKGEIAARLEADTDPLTGLLNRRAFLAQAIGREGEHVLMIVDLDHFKLVNETIGHDGGDEVLRVVGRSLRLAVPETALVARIGGEEFAIVLPIAIAPEPRDILAKLRAARMPYDVAVTASIGKCVGPLLREPDWKALYACADRALFDAKSAGRDRARDRVLHDLLTVRALAATTH